jgi:hypothetical protein
MRKQIQVSVTSPCQEDWNKMHPNTNGRYCDQCEKTVIDFTGKSDAEIFRLLAKNDQNVCGRFTNVQLDRSIAEPISQKRKNVWAMLMTALLTLSASVSNAQKRKIGKLAVKTELAEAQKQEEMLRKAAAEKQIAERQLLGEVVITAPQKQIAVTVIGDDDKILSGASVYIHGSLKRIVANDEGEILYNRNEIGKKAEVSFIGYESQTITLAENTDTIVLRSKKNELQPVCIKSEITVVAGGISVRRVEEKRKPAKKPTPILSPSSVTIQASGNASFIKNIYPNPVHPGTDIRIELPAGNYTLQLLNTEGKTFESGSTMINKGLYGSMKISTTLPAGQYFVRAIDLKTGKQAVKSLLIAF